MFILKFDTGMEQMEKAFTLSELRSAKGLCLRDPLCGLELGPGTPTEDEQFLFDTFTKHAMGEPPLCMAPDRALVKACEDLESRIAERVQAAQDRGDLQARRAVSVGRYRISKYHGPEGGVWIENDDGEGMRCLTEKFEAVVHDFFEKEF